ncbi:MAG TPA: biopolymer transporter ExbD [Gammaproteobacteria bacterium]|nr:biopolymer transporter ExbD [Gammaproteobacteria bacterium]
MKFRSRSEQTPSVELTPLIDVVFLLLIFFMISTTFVSRSGLQVRVPEAETTQPNPDRPRVEVMVTKEGGYLVDGKDLPADADLAAVLRRKADDGEQPLLVIRADRDARHGDVTAVMDAGKKVGLNRIAISTREESGGSTP